MTSIKEENYRYIAYSQPDSSRIFFAGILFANIDQYSTENLNVEILGIYKADKDGEKQFLEHAKTTDDKIKVRNIIRNFKKYISRKNERLAKCILN